VEREANYAAVGAFVLLVALLGALFVYWYSDTREHRNYNRYEIYFSGSVSGLERGAAVRYLGVGVGRVVELHIDPRDSSRVEVIVDIDATTPISAHTVAQLQLQGVTGLLYIDLFEARSDKVLAPAVAGLRFPVIRSGPSRFDVFLASLPELVAAAGDVVQRADLLLNDTNLHAVSSTLGSLDEASSKLPQTMRDLNALVAELRGASADRVLVEAFLPGEEVSFMALCDGEHVLPLATARDYKRIGDGDTGPNTGGMGAHSPSGGLTKEAGALVVETILHPTVAGLAAEGRPFVGVLYAGLMLTPEGPQVLEFNARFGDPEAQVILLRLEDDLLPILAAGAAGRFEARRLSFRREVAACVVLASPGYPGRPVQGEPIRGLDRAAALPGVEIFHAGTANAADAGGELVSAGGRVLSVCAVDPSLAEALRKAYAAVAEIDWPSKVYRHDIGRQLLDRTPLDAGD